MEVIQTLTDCVEICVRHGVEHVILCPGSRNAALIIAFEQNPKIACYSVSDERVAAFIAVGMAMATKKPAAIVCTSGTAALNFAPAIAEAFFQEIPLLVLTADRPPEWIDQYDGQTVFQENTYGKHVKAAYKLLPDFTNQDVQWFANRTFNEALIQCCASPKGPVHINIPIREPFYPKATDSFLPSTSLRVIKSAEISDKLPTELADSLVEQIIKCDSVWIIVGQQDDHRLTHFLANFKKMPNTLVIGDILGNITSDLLAVDNIFAVQNEVSPPDLLITCGKSIITKRLKMFLRRNKSTTHWHVQKTAVIRDPYQSITHQFNLNAIDFFDQLSYSQAFNKTTKSTLKKNEIVKKDHRIIEAITTYLFKIEFSDLKCVAAIIERIPPKSILHLGNSMSVRYANAVSHLLNKTIEVHCNRGTSGIEGSVSTAVGQAMLSKQDVYCIVGDVSFLYDKNALWHNYLPKNLKIIILNNGGGNIFRMITGPMQQNSYSDFFETKQTNSAEFIAAHYNIPYVSVNETAHLADAARILELNQAVIVECFTTAHINEKVYKELLSLG